jgi:hypothetical protein
MLKLLQSACLPVGSSWSPGRPGVRQPPRGSRHGCVQTGNADRGEARGLALASPSPKWGFAGSPPSISRWQEPRVLKLEAGRCPSGAHGRLHSRLQWPKSRLQPATAPKKEIWEGAGSQAPGVCQCAVFKFQGRFETKLARVGSLLEWASRARLSLLLGNFRVLIKNAGLRQHRDHHATAAKCWHWRCQWRLGNGIGNMQT